VQLIREKKSFDLNIQELGCELKLLEGAYRPGLSGTLAPGSPEINQLAICYLHTDSRPTVTMPTRVLRNSGTKYRSRQHHFPVPLLFTDWRKAFSDVCKPTDFRNKHDCKITRLITNSAYKYSLVGNWLSLCFVLLKAWSSQQDECVHLIRGKQVMRWGFCSLLKRPTGKLSRRCNDNINLVKRLWKLKVNWTASGSCAVAKFGI
jgi:hypothetical protein